jgi:hypothetical protein
VPGVHATFARDHEYKRYGTLSLLAGIDLLTGKVHALVRDRHRSKEFIEFLKLLDAAYPASTAIKDHVSRRVVRTPSWTSAVGCGALASDNQYVEIIAVLRSSCIFGMARTLL